MNSKEVRDSWTEYLQLVSWDAFTTLTFGRRDFPLVFPRDLIKADTLFRKSLIRPLSEHIHGPRWLRKFHREGIIWARVAEPHADGALHYHALFHFPRKPIDGQIIRIVKDCWERRHGIARVEVPMSQHAVSSYLSKNVGKLDRADIEISANFPRRG